MFHYSDAFADNTLNATNNLDIKPETSETGTETQKMSLLETKKIYIDYLGPY